VALHIIIDGYNLIKNSPALSALDRQDLQLGREALIDRLAGYKKIKSHKITVVFDGAGAIDAASSRDRIKGIQMVFSRRGQSADAVIKKMASKEREKALVVSSDRDVALAAASFQSATISAAEFEARLALADQMDSAGDAGDDEGGWVPTTRKKGPDRRLSKRRRRNRMKVRKL
jgi:predicted RNA-binding protein with PIN domain